jgi:hypothetical protein
MSSDFDHWYHQILKAESNWFQWDRSVARFVLK